MTALDTSVVIPALLQWHEAHPSAHRAATGGSVPAHVLVESYAVLTRLPAPHRVADEVAAELLAAWFPPTRVLLPPPRLARAVVARLVEAGVRGGASYDGLVGLTAAAHGMTLLTRDERAAATYAALGVPFRRVSDET